MLCSSSQQSHSWFTVVIYVWSWLCGWFWCWCDVLSLIARLIVGAADSRAWTRSSEKTFNTLYVCGSLPLEETSQIFWVSEGNFRHVSNQRKGLGAAQAVRRECLCFSIVSASFRSFLVFSVDTARCATIIWIWALSINLLLSCRFCKFSMATLKVSSATVIHVNILEASPLTTDFKNRNYKQPVNWSLSINAPIERS